MMSPLPLQFMVDVTLSEINNNSSSSNNNSNPMEMERSYNCNFAVRVAAEWYAGLVAERMACQILLLASNSWGGAPRGFSEFYLYGGAAESI